MNGTQVVANPVIGSLAPGWHARTTADFNGDGKADILLDYEHSGALSIWQMNGTVVEANPVIGTVLPGWFLEA